MTYTFKLARRLAISRYTSAATLVVLAACSAGDTTAPIDAPNGELPDVSEALVNVTPDTVTLETNQTVRFTGRAHTQSDDSVGTAVEWTASGGTISEDGLFSSAEAGTFRIVGRGRKKADTATVVVVPPQPTLASLTISPATISLTTGAAQQFAATAKLSDNTTTTIGVTWTATGGTIDASGNYTAGSTAGTYRVIATNTAGTVGDTAAVTITAPAPAPAPTLAQVVMNPGSASLLTGGTKQLAAYGRMSNGDSVAVSVTYTATGGTVTSNGLYTAGSTAGAYRVIARASSGPADTAAITLTAPAPAPVPAGAGVVFGVWHLPPASYASTVYTGAYLGYGTGVSASTPAGFINQIAQAKAANRRLVVNLVGRKSSSLGGPDMAYYLAGLEQFRPYVAQLQAYANDGTIVGIMMADEPNCGSCWAGKAWTVDQMQQAAEAVKALVPNIPRGFRVDPAWLKGKNAPALYAVLDFAWLQYEGPLHTPCARAVTDCITSASTAATSIGLKLIMGMNTLDGGDGSSGIPGTYNLATVSTRWQLSAAEVLKYGLALVRDSRVCAVLSWRYGANATKSQINSQMSDQQLADILSFDTRMRAPLDSVAKVAAQQPTRSCAKG